MSMINDFQLSMVDLTTGGVLRWVRNGLGLCSTFCTFGSLDVRGRCGSGQENSELQAPGDVQIAMPAVVDDDGG